MMARAAAAKRPSKRPAFKSSSRQSSSFILILIGLFKLAKAVLLIAVGIGALKFLHKDLSSAVMHWIQVLRVDPDNRYIHGMLLRIFRLTPKQLKAVSVGTFLYAGVFLIEGIGLLLRKQWAEYFTIIATGSFIPLEVYELVRHFTAVKLGVTVVNILIVGYLVARVRSRRK